MATTARFTGAANVDNTDSRAYNDFETVTYSATPTLAVIAKAASSIKVIALTGAATLAINVGTATTAPFVGDKLQLQLTADATSRIVTFGTGFLSTGTLSVTTAKYAVANFVFNGTGWLETGRAVSA